MADYSKIAQILDTKLSTMSGLPSSVQYENTTITLPNTGLALEAWLIPSESVYNTLGILAKAEESGVYQVNIVSKPNIGRGVALTMAQTIRDFFSHGLILSKDGTYVRIVKASLHQGKSDGVNYMIPVSIYYLSYS
jgi:hypothetical protein